MALLRLLAKLALDRRKCDLIKPSITYKLRVLLNFKSENIIRFIKKGRFSSHRMNITHYNYTENKRYIFSMKRVNNVFFLNHVSLAQKGSQETVRRKIPLKTRFIA